MKAFVLLFSQVHKNGNRAGDPCSWNEIHIFCPTLQMSLQRTGNCNACRWLLAFLKKTMQLRRYSVFYGGRLQDHKFTIELRIVTIAVWNLSFNPSYYQCQSLISAIKWSKEATKILLLLLLLGHQWRASFSLFCKYRYLSQSYEHDSKMLEQRNQDILALELSVLKNTWQMPIAGLQQWQAMKLFHRATGLKPRRQAAKSQLP